jgi:hypothetical protein
MQKESVMIQRCSFGGRRWWRVISLGVVLLLALCLYSLGAARQSLAGGADIAVTLSPDPNVLVTPGSIISYQIRVKNFGGSDASRVLVHMPYDPLKLQVLDASFTSDQDWVSAVESNYLMVVFGSIGGHQTRTATIRMYVADQLPEGTVIDMWAGYGWDDNNGGGANRSANPAPVVVGTQDVASGAVWLGVEPAAGPTGTIYSFFTNRFAPHERLYAWIETPYGIRSLQMETMTNDTGEAWFVFDSTGYAPGVYEYIVRSERTELVAVAQFTIQ